MFLFLLLTKARRDYKFKPQKHRCFLYNKYRTAFCSLFCFLVHHWTFRHISFIYAIYDLAIQENAIYLHHFFFPNTLNILLLSTFLHLYFLSFYPTICTNICNHEVNFSQQNSTGSSEQLRCSPQLYPLYMKIDILLFALLKIQTYFLVCKQNIKK